MATSEPIIPNLSPVISPPLENIIISDLSNFPPGISEECNALRNETWQNSALVYWEAWNKQVARLNDIRTTAHENNEEISFENDPCNPENACRFREFFVNTNNLTHQGVLLSTSTDLSALDHNFLFNHNHQAALSEIWAVRDKCCQKFTAKIVDTQLTQHKTWWYIAMVIFSSIMNIIMLFDIMRAGRKMQHIKFKENFPKTRFLLAQFKHFGTLNIIRALFVDTVMAFWSYTYWWNFSESYCKMFQYRRRTMLVTNSMLAMMAQLSLIFFGGTSTPGPCIQKLLKWILPIGWCLSIIFTYAITLMYKTIPIFPDEIHEIMETHHTEIEMPDQNLFRKEVIDELFHCALPIECVDDNDFPIWGSIYMFMFHIGIPILATLLRVTVGCIRGDQPKSVNAKHKISLKSDSSKAAILEKDHIEMNNSNNNEEENNKTKIEATISVEEVRAQEDATCFTMMQYLTYFFYIFFAPYCFYNLAVDLDPSLITKLDTVNEGLSHVIANLSECLVGLFNVAIPLYWVFCTDKVQSLLENERIFRHEQMLLKVDDSSEELFEKDPKYDPKRYL